MWQEFKKFAFKGNVIDMAVGVIIGGAFGKIVTSVVNDLVMPALGMLTGGVDFSTLKWVMSPAELDAAGNVIKEEAAILEKKVHSLLYLNKLDYLKDSKIHSLELIDMVSILNSEVEKFKFHNKNINFIVDIDKKSKYYGTNEHWETILDNLLGNFMRYAKTTIKITAKQNKLILYNDGDNIDKDLLEGIFTPFRKGIKGEFGLGLSIVKKTLNIMDYDITIRNEKKGVSFIIAKENRK